MFIEFAATLRSQLASGLCELCQPDKIGIRNHSGLPGKFR
jgi:hypothetical protein